MVNGNTGAVGIFMDTIAPLRSKVFGPEGVLTDINILGMERPIAQIKLAEKLAEGGGILSSLQTGVKKMTAARKGRGTGAPARRYRPPSEAPPPPTQQPFEGSPIPAEDEVVFI